MIKFECLSTAAKSQITLVPGITLKAISGEVIIPLLGEVTTTIASKSAITITFLMIKEEPTTIRGDALIDPS